MSPTDLLRTRPNMPWYVELVVTALLATLGLLYANYHEDSIHASADLTSRVTTVEQKQKDDSQKVDHIQTQVDKLVEWALGHK